MKKNLILLGIILGIIGCDSTKIPEDKSSYDAACGCIKKTHKSVIRTATRLNGFGWEMCVPGYYILRDEYFKLLFNKNGQYYITPKAFSCSEKRLNYQVYAKAKIIINVAVKGRKNVKRFKKMVAMFPYKNNGHIFGSDEIVFKKKDIVRLTRWESLDWMTKHPETVILNF